MTGCPMTPAMAAITLASLSSPRYIHAQATAELSPAPDPTPGYCRYRLSTGQLLLSRRNGPVWNTLRESNGTAWMTFTMVDDYHVDALACNEEGTIYSLAQRLTRSGC